MIRISDAVSLYDRPVVLLAIRLVEQELQAQGITKTCSRPTDGQPIPKGCTTAGDIQRRINDRLAEVLAPFRVEVDDTGPLDLTIRIVRTGEPPRKPDEPYAFRPGDRVAVIDFGTRHGQERIVARNVPRAMGNVVYLVEADGRGESWWQPEDLALVHTVECLAYAQRTGKDFCIAPCGNLRAGKITAEQYRAEVAKAEQP